MLVENLDSNEKEPRRETQYAQTAIGLSIGRIVLWSVVIVVCRCVVGLGQGIGRTWRRVLTSGILTPCARILVVGTGVTMHQWKGRIRSKIEGRY